jgi:hypothetical protein
VHRLQAALVLILFFQLLYYSLFLELETSELNFSLDRR